MLAIEEPTDAISRCSVIYDTNVPRVPGARSRLSECVPYFKYFALALPWLGLNLTDTAYEKGLYPIAVLLTSHHSLSWVVSRLGSVAQRDTGAPHAQQPICKVRKHSWYRSVPETVVSGWVDFLGSPRSLRTLLSAETAYN